MGVLAKYGVELIGASAEAIEKAEDRQLFSDAMDAHRPRVPAGGSSPTPSRRRSAPSSTSASPPSYGPPSPSAAPAAASPTTARTSSASCKTGLDASPGHRVLIDESLLGWKEFEMEVVRDSADNCIIVCSIENVDPMGVHTGDCITVAPAQTLTDKEYQLMRDASIAVLREIGVETGGSNVQFAVHPDDWPHARHRDEPARLALSALASKATGFPIAKIAAKLAVGYTLDELDNDITQVHAGLLRADDRLRRRPRCRAWPSRSSRRDPC